MTTDDFTVDLTGVPEVDTDENGRVILPKGRYLGTVKAVEAKVGAKGPYYNWEVDINDPDYGRVKVWAVTSFSENVRGATKRTVEGFLDGEKMPPGVFNAKDYLEEILSRLIGRTVAVSVAPTTDQNNNQKNGVQNIRAAGPSEAVAQTGAPNTPTKRVKF